MQLEMEKAKFIEYPAILWKFRGNHRLRAPWGRSETVEIHVLRTNAHYLAPLRGENMKKY